MIWVVNTNTNTCHIYNYQKKPPQLELFKELSHAETKLGTGDFLTSDKPGHYQGGISARGAYSPETEPKAVEIDNFSREIAHVLEHGRNDHSYEQLIIIASPHMNGVLHQHLNQHVKSLVVNNIKKDFQRINDKDLLEFLKEHTQYHDKN